MAEATPFSDKKEPGFYTDILEDGYHIFSLKSVKVPGFYPSKFPDYPGVKLNDLSLGDRITIRAFFGMGSSEPIKIEGGLIDLEVEHIDTEHILGVILTKLPEGLPLQTGGSLEIVEDEIIYKIKKT